MVPKLDCITGMTEYGTDFAGTGGRIRERREDFVVREQLREGALAKLGQEPGGYAVYALKKDGIDTAHALREAERMTGARLRALGLKDARAATEQYVCAASKSRGPPGCRGARFSLERIGFLPRPLSKRDMAGNGFEIRIAGMAGSLEDFDGYDAIPNYFGYQRFGARRPVTHLVGRAIIRGDYAEAVRLAVYADSKFDHPERRALRQRISPLSHAEALEELPRAMDTERIMLSALAKGKSKEDAVRAVPVAMRRFFVQAFQSYVFNVAASAALAAGEDLAVPQEKDVCYGADGALARAVPGVGGQAVAIPLAGHSYYAKTRFEPYIAQALAEEEMQASDFFIRGMQEASAEGGFRNALVGCSSVRASGNTAQFVLSRGSYATVVLREVIRPDDPAAAGLA